MVQGHVSKFAVSCPPGARPVFVGLGGRGRACTCMGARARAGAIARNPRSLVPLEAMTDGARVPRRPPSEAERLAVGELFQPFSPRTRRTRPATSTPRPTRARGRVQPAVLRLPGDEPRRGDARAARPGAVLVGAPAARAGGAVHAGAAGAAAGRASSAAAGAVQQRPAVARAARLLFSKAFTPARVAAMEPQIRRFAEEFAAELAKKRAGRGSS